MSTLKFAVFGAILPPGLMLILALPDWYWMAVAAAIAAHAGWRLMTDGR